MGVRRDDNLRWVLIEPGVLVRVEGETVAGLLVYGGVTAQRLRSIRLGRLDHIPQTSGVNAPRADDGSIPLAHAFPEWQQAQPPTPEEAKEAEAALGKKGVGTLVPKEGKRRLPIELRREVSQATVKRRGQSADEFYARFARMYLSVATTTPSPNQLIAEISGLSTNLIKQYVHRARALGYLPPSRRSH